MLHPVERPLFLMASLSRAAGGKEAKPTGSIPEHFLSHKEHPEELGFAKLGRGSELSGGTSRTSKRCFAALLLLS